MAGLVLGPPEPVGRHELPGLVVHPGDVGLQLGGLHPPLSPAADLDRRQLAGPHQGVDLGGRDVQGLGDVGELEEARPGAGNGHGPEYACGCLRLRAAVHRAQGCGPSGGGPPGVRQDGRLVRPHAPGGAVTDLPAPTATRLTRARWLDARLLIGLLLVLLSVVIGAKVVADADQRVQVWSVTHDLGADTPADRRRPAGGVGEPRRRHRALPRGLGGPRRAGPHPPGRARRAAAGHRGRSRGPDRAAADRDRGRPVRGGRAGQGPGGRRLRRAARPPAASRRPGPSWSWTASRSART